MCRHLATRCASTRVYAARVEHRPHWLCLGAQPILNTRLLQITCKISQDSPAGLSQCLRVLVGGKGAAGAPEDFCLNISTLRLDAVSVPGGGNVISTHGATEVSVNGGGFDIQTCSHNIVTLGGEDVCKVTQCSRTSLLATCAPSSTDQSYQDNAETDVAATMLDVRVRVVNAAGVALGDETLSLALGTSHGGATAPFCHLQDSGVTLGSAATVDLLCSKAALDAGVVSLHMTNVLAAGVATETSSPARRLREANSGRRLAQMADGVMPDAEDAAYTFPCKVRAAMLLLDRQ